MSGQTKLVIDIGNRRAKWALMASAEQGTEQIAQQGAIELSQLVASEPAVQSLLSAAQRSQAIVIASVADATINQQLQALLAPTQQPIYELTMAALSQQPCALRNAYQTPTQLGIDRWCAAYAAWHLAQQDCLIVNAGSALTVDGVHQDTYLGGIICPGLALQQQALAQLAFHKQSAQSNLAQAEVAAWTGNWQAFPINSQDACYNGVLRAMTGAIQQQYALFQQRSGAAPIYLTGGDAPLLAPLLEAQGMPLIHQANLVLKGIYLLASQS
jgi:type III pantothenate kinase